MNSDSEQESSNFFEDTTEENPTIYRHAAPLTAQPVDIYSQHLPLKNVQAQNSAFAPPPVKFQAIIQPSAEPSIQLPQQHEELPFYDDKEFPNIHYTAMVISKQTPEHILRSIAQSCHRLQLHYSVCQGYLIDISTQINGQEINCWIKLQRDRNCTSNIKVIMENCGKHDFEYLRLWKRLKRDCALFKTEPYDDLTDSDNEEELYPTAMMVSKEEMTDLVDQLLNEDTKEFTKLEIAKSLATFANFGFNRHTMTQLLQLSDVLRCLLQYELEEMQRYGIHILTELSKDTSLTLPLMNGLPDQLMKLIQEHEQPNLTTEMAHKLYEQITQS